MREMTAVVLEGKFRIDDNGTINATSTRAAPCDAGGICVGLDLCDENGDVFAHAHWDAHVAIEVATSIIEIARAKLIASGVSHGN